MRTHSIPRVMSGLALVLALCVHSLRAVGDDRLAVPSPADQARAVADVRKIFREDLAKTKPDELRAVVAKLLEVAAAETISATRHALLVEAQSAAVRADDLKLVLSAVDQRTKVFIVDPDQERADAVAALSKSSKDVGTHKAIVLLCADAAESCIARGELDAADRWLRPADASLIRAKENVLVRRVGELRAAVVAGRRELALYQAATAKLLEKPDDPDAHLVVGRYWCFLRNEWDKGLPHLARSRDAALAELAGKDASNPTDSALQSSLASAWWDYSEKQPPAQRPPLQRRAARWYSAALPGLEGLAKTVAQKRIAAATAAGEGAEAVASKVADVLAKVDLEKHVAGGRWSRDKGTVTVQPDNNARLILPVTPATDEYDLLVEFTRHSGNQGFGVHLCAGDRTFLWQLSGVDNQFASVNNFKDEPQNPSHKRYALPADAKKHVALIRIRKKGVSVDLDGKNIFAYSTDYSNHVQHDWGFGGKTLGLISWYNVVSFHRVELREQRSK